jgi:hypothetical protein
MAFGTANQIELYHWLEEALTNFKKERGVGLQDRLRVTFNALKADKVKPIFAHKEFFLFVEGQIILNQLSNGKKLSPNTIIKHDKWKNIAVLIDWNAEFINTNMKDMRRPVGAIMSKVIRILKAELEIIYDEGLDNVPQMKFLWVTPTNIWFFRFKNAVITQDEAISFCNVLEGYGITASNEMATMKPELKRFVYNRFCRALKSTVVVRDVSDEVQEFWNAIWATLVIMIGREEEWDSMSDSFSHVRSAKKSLPIKPVNLKPRQKFV